MSSLERNRVGLTIVGFPKDGICLLWCYYECIVILFLRVVTGETTPTLLSMWFELATAYSILRTRSWRSQKTFAANKSLKAFAKIAVASYLQCSINSYKRFRRPFVPYSLSTHHFVDYFVLGTGAPPPVDKDEWTKRWNAHSKTYGE